jgi:hypothetical protein
MTTGLPVPKTPEPPDRREHGCGMAPAGPCRSTGCQPCPTAARQPNEAGLPHRTDTPRPASGGLPPPRWPRSSRPPGPTRVRTSGSSLPTPGSVPASCPRLLTLRCPRQLPAPWHPHPSAPVSLGVPSPGPSSSGGPSAPTSSPARAAEAPGVVAVVLRSTTAQAILQHLRLPSRPLPVAPATSPPQLDFW